MSIELTAAISRTWYLERFKKHNSALAGGIPTADYINHNPYAPPGRFGKGPQASKNAITLYHTAFSGLTFTVQRDENGGLAASQVSFDLLGPLMRTGIISQLQRTTWAGPQADAQHDHRPARPFPAPRHSGPSTGS